jgi:hypothetical protein
MRKISFSFLSVYLCLGAVVGPTFGCLLGQQFQILKKGDRFWYENNIPPSAFTKGENITSKVQNRSFFGTPSPSR